MAGIKITPDQIDQKIAYQEFKDHGGSPFVVAHYTIDPDLNQKTESLDKPIPLFIAAQSEETNDWIWREATPSQLGEKTGVLIGTTSYPPGTDTKSDKFHRLKENRFNSLIVVTDVWQNREKQEGEKNWGWIDSQINEALDLGAAVIRIAHLLGTESIPGWLSSKNKDEIEALTQEHIQEHMRYIYSRVEKECTKRGIDKLTIEFNVVNELSYGEVFYKISGGRDRFVLISCQKALEIKDAILSEKGNTTPNIQIRLGISDYDSHYVGGKGYKALYEFLEMLESNNVYMDYVDFHGHEKDVFALPDLHLIDEAIRSFANYKNISGEPISVTIGEYDLNIMNWENDPQRFLKQAERYYAVFNIFLNAGVKEIILWGVADDESWYEEKDIDSGYYSPNADALVFEESGKPKPGYYAISAAMQQYMVS